MSETSSKEEVYYRDRYWNDHPLVLSYFRRLLLNGRDSKPMWWQEHFYHHYLNKKPRGKALFLNCGNGWAERELYDIGCFRECVAFDYSSELLKQAEALRGTRNIKYIQADCNTVTFPPNEFDLVFNVASLHHVQYLNRMLRVLTESLRPDGLCVNFDYVGPHRNQYSPTLWDDMVRVNNLLPEGLRAAPFIAPHLETIIAHDPSEAVHSELILEYFERYFFTIERIDLNGVIPYQIMHNNFELFAEHTFVNDAVQFLVDLDELYARVGGRPPLFSFWVGSPKKQVLEKVEQLEKWREEEQVREEHATKNNGRYF